VKNAVQRGFWVPTQYLFCQPWESSIDLVAGRISYNKSLNSNFLPHRIHFISVPKTNRLIFFRKMIASCSGIPMKYIATLRENNSDLFNVVAALHMVFILL
jgi:hypothetical protein